MPFTQINTFYEKEGNKILLNETQKMILIAIRNNPNITKEQLQSKIKKGKTAIDRGISFLKEKGFIERIGSNKNGYWKVHID